MATFQGGQRFQITQSSNPWADVFGDTLDQFSDVLPEIINYRREIEDNDDAAGQTLEELGGLFQRVREDQGLADKMVNAGTVADFEEFQLYMDAEIAEIAGARDGTKVEILSRINESIGKVAALGGSGMSSDWLIDYGNATGTDASAQIASNDAKARAGDIRGIKDADKRIEAAYADEDFYGRNQGQVRAWENQRGEDRQLAEQEETEGIRSERIKEVSDNKERWENFNGTAEKAYVEALNQYNDPEIARAAADMRQAAINEDNLDYSRETARIRGLDDEDIISAEDILKNTEMNNQSLVYFQNQVTELSDDIMELETKKSAAESPEEKTTFTRQISNLNKAIKIASEAAGLIESNLISGSSTTGQQASAEVQARSDVQAQVPEAIRGAEAAFEEGTAGFGNFMSQILPGGRNASRDELIKANEALGQYGITVENDGGNLKFIDSQTNTEITADEVEEELAQGGADGSGSLIKTWLENNQQNAPASTPIPFKQPTSELFDLL